MMVTTPQSTTKPLTPSRRTCAGDEIIFKKNYDAMLKSGNSLIE
jgi:hypothetical protein